MSTNPEFLAILNNVQNQIQGIDSLSRKFLFSLLSPPFKEIYLSGFQLTSQNEMWLCLFMWYTSKN